jgi:hypothetical protein
VRRMLLLRPFGRFVVRAESVLPSNRDSTHEPCPKNNLSLDNGSPTSQEEITDRQRRVFKKTFETSAVLANGKQQTKQVFGCETFKFSSKFFELKRTKENAKTVRAECIPTNPSVKTTPILAGNSQKRLERITFTKVTRFFSNSQNSIYCSPKLLPDLQETRKSFRKKFRFFFQNGVVPETGDLYDISFLQTVQRSVQRICAGTRSQSRDIFIHLSIQ